MADLLSQIYDMLWLPRPPTVYNAHSEVSINSKELIRTAMLLRYQSNFELLNDSISLLTNRILWNHFKLILCRFCGHFDEPAKCGI